MHESGIKYSHSAKVSYVYGSEKEYYCVTCTDPRI